MNLIQSITDFFTTNINLYLLAIIVLGGFFATKYTAGLINIKNRYKVFFASIIVSAIFYILEDCKSDCFSQYFFTYFFATSFYELLLKAIVDKVKGSVQ